MRCLCNQCSTFNKGVTDGGSGDAHSDRNHARASDVVITRSDRIARSGVALSHDDRSPFQNSIKRAIRETFDRGSGSSANGEAGRDSE